MAEVLAPVLQTNTAAAGRSSKKKSLHASLRINFESITKRAGLLAVARRTTKNSPAHRTSTSCQGQTIPSQSGSALGFLT